MSDENDVQTIGDVLAERVRRYRQVQGLKQEEVARRTEALGHRLGQATLAKLEAGGTRAAGASLVDVLVLAAALNVPPPLLFLPLGEAEGVELAPGFVVHPHIAFDWVSGDDDVRSVVPWPSVGAWHNNERPILMFRGLRKRENAVHEAQAALSQERQSRIDPEQPDARERAKAAVASVLAFDGPAEDFRRIDQALIALDAWREAMRDTGLRPPVLHKEWQARIDELVAD